MARNNFNYFKKKETQAEKIKRIKEKVSHTIETKSEKIRTDLKQGLKTHGGKYQVGNRVFKTEKGARSALRAKNLSLMGKISEQNFKKNWSKDEIKQYRQLKKEYNQIYKDLSKEERKNRKMLKFANILAGAKNKQFGQFKSEIDKIIGSDLNSISDRIKTDKNHYYENERLKLTGRLKLIFKKLKLEDLNEIDEISYEYYNVADNSNAEEETALLNNRLNVIFKKYER